MKFIKVFYAFALIILGVFSITCSAQNSGQESQADSNASMSEVYGSKEIHKNFNVEKGQKLSINLKTGGSISITAWGKNEVKVDASIDGEDWEDFLVEFEKDNSGININSRFKHQHDNVSSNAHFDIVVPSEFDIELNTMGGSLTIDGVNGKISGQTMGGGLTLSNLKGYLDLSTMGGNVSLTKSEVDGNVHTMGGEVDFEDITGDVKGSSMGGKVTMKNVTRKSGESTGDEVDISSMGGEINVDTAPNGANVSTMGGEINISSAKKFVKAKTMGGNIKIDDVDGSVNASTMSGKINVKEICNPNDGDRDIELESQDGDITLFVPAGFSMDVDITLSYTKDMEGKYKIISDFDLDRTQTDKWDHHKGSARKYIYGKASINGGKNKVTIKTINGDVHLEKIE
ncbi:MAG: hypothetical protein P4L45_05100 [Ignavibacteriaceae bacterium]|nr:hypothetical protein [Ignavibacteriaceae bacterium]